MAVTVDQNPITKTATITGSSDGELINVAALVPAADPSWTIQIHPDAGNDTVNSRAVRNSLDASAGDDTGDGGGELDALRFDLSSLHLTGTLSLDPGGAVQS